VPLLGRGRCQARHRGRWRIESARLIAGTARLVRDVGLAEDLAQEALVAALERWPESGVPDNRAPG
jgi:predicted RNA polymerase sigma factor